MDASSRAAGPAEHRDGPLLCGVDGRESRRALLAAARLADALGARVLLEHVASSPEQLPAGMASQRVHVRDRIVEAAEQVLAEAASEPFDEPPADEAMRQAERRVDFGDPVTRLASCAEEVGARLIVVGARGRHPAKAAVLGSVSQRLAAEQSRPVLVVPSGSDIPRFATPAEDERSVVCGFDGSDNALRAARTAAWLASSLERRLILAHVAEAGVPSATDGIEYEDVLEADARPRLRLLERASQATADADVEVTLLTGAVGPELERLAARKSADLIVVGTRGHGALKALALGSVSRGLASSASRPVVVVNDPPPASK